MKTSKFAAALIVLTSCIALGACEPVPAPLTSDVTGKPEQTESSSSFPEKETGNENSDTGGTSDVKFDKNNFMEYFKDVPHFFHEPLENTSSLIKSPPAGFFLVYQTYFLNASKGIVFEKDENGNDMIPKEDIAVMAHDLLGIDFDFSCIEEHPSEVGGRIPGTDFYRFNTGIDIASGELTIDESSVQINGDQISVDVVFRYHPAGPGDYIVQNLTYLFTFNPNNTFQYQLMKITPAE